MTVIILNGNYPSPRGKAPKGAVGNESEALKAVKLDENNAHLQGENSFYISFKDSGATLGRMEKGVIVTSKLKKDAAVHGQFMALIGVLRNAEHDDAEVDVAMAALLASAELAGLTHISLSDSFHSAFKAFSDAVARYNARLALGADVAEAAGADAGCVGKLTCSLTDPLTTYFGRVVSFYHTANDALRRAFVEAYRQEAVCLLLGAASLPYAMPQGMPSREAAGFFIRDAMPTPPAIDGALDKSPVASVSRVLLGVFDSIGSVYSYFRGQEMIPEAHGSKPVRYFFTPAGSAPGIGIELKDGSIYVASLMQGPFDEIRAAFTPELTAGMSDVDYNTKVGDFVAKAKAEPWSHSMYAGYDMSRPGQTTLLPQEVQAYVKLRTSMLAGGNQKAPVGVGTFELPTESPSGDATSVLGMAATT